MTESVFASLTFSALAGPMLLTGWAWLGSLLLHATLSVPLALWLSRRETRWATVMGFVSTLPLIFPPIALGYLLMVLLGQHGLVGYWLLEWWNWRVLFSPTAVIFAAWVAGVPLVVRPLRASFSSNAVRDLEAAGALCGLSPVRTFFLITLPLVRRSLAAAFLLASARAIGEVGITLMLGGNIEGRTATVSLEIFNAVGRGDFEVATALCGVLAVISLLLYGLLERLGHTPDDQESAQS